MRISDAIVLRTPSGHEAILNADAHSDAHPFLRATMDWVWTRCARQRNPPPTLRCHSQLAEELSGC